MDVGLSKYRKLIDTLPQSCNKTGLDLQQVDLTLMLLRSLPNDVKNYIVLHSAGESYADYRTASLKYEQQQRLFQEIGAHGSSRNVHALEADYSDWDGYYGNDYDGEQDYPTDGAEEEWEWDPDSELWLNTAAINKNSSVKGEVEEMWKIWTHSERLSHEYGSCEVLQMRTERTYRRQLPVQQSEVSTVLTQISTVISIFELSEAEIRSERTWKGRSQRKDA